MNILLRSATIIDASSKYHLKKRDILIENGKISEISNSITTSKAVKEIKLNDLHVSPGWFDSSVSFGEPGYEERENVENGINTAAASGFTHVAINANTNPVTDSKSDVQFIKSKANNSAINIYVVGALSAQGKGVDLAELYDMNQEGAISFYDYKKPIKNPNLLKLALQYAQNFNGLVQSFPIDPNISSSGLVNEEKNSTMLGLKGIPALAEELQIIRDLYILEYTGGKLHIPTISTKKSVELIKTAKKKGLNVSCSVAIHNVFLTDEVLESYDTNFKVMPPLRTSKDVKALIKGLKEGTIDGITSDHNPMDIESKNVEFDHASFGSIGLEAAFGAANKLLDIETTIISLTKLKETFDIQSAGISEGNFADITFFNPHTEWTLTEEDLMSTSKNAALRGQKLKGKVYGIFSNNKLVMS